EVMLSAAGAKAEAEGLKARVTEEANKLRAAAEKWEAAGTKMSAFTSAAQAVENRTYEIAEGVGALEAQLLFGKKDNATAETIERLAAKMAPTGGRSGNKGFAMTRGDEIVALANDMIWLCNLVGSSGSTGCGVGSTGVCACAYKGYKAAGKTGWHGMEAEGQGANPTQIENNNWPITAGICEGRGKGETKQSAEDISTHMIAALATLRARLKPDKAATDNPTNTYCLGQAGNQGCDATSNQQEACVCYAKETAEKTGGLPGWAPTAVEIAARMREAAQLERQIHSLREEAQRAADTDKRWRQHLETLRQSGATTSRDSKGKDTAPSHQKSRRTGNTQSENHTTRTETTGDQGSQTDSKRECDRTHPNWDGNTKTCANTATARTAFWAAAACVAQLTAVRPI
ncbi:expression site-associated gene, (ESAG) putative, partial [Trypanosoma vivax Y486]